MGWLRSVPERNKKEDKRSRFEQYGEDHPYTALPDVGTVDYMTSLFADSGMASPGPAPLSWQDIDAYNRCAALAMTPWEMGQIMEMSRSYCQWTIKGGKQGDIAEDVPYIEKDRSTAKYIEKQRDASAGRRNGK